MTIENAKGSILVNMLFWGGGAKKIPGRDRVKGKIKQDKLST